ncbi:SWI5-dependent HO expression protein 4 [Yamadazyma tenuis]|uniref:UNC-45/Cro1/She4 central domain-containing protein n=1 Tax=Candida tenuis (strain ATCC 10573 / BCRC 21748 / CBS 615 / JCM 9827 / NBRC 10315 / NRRL Y-1498 / VKM Y-70) TaxID=590646 RepID=G3BFP3_CANTC|nr:uncharacterized protein CANTEDRAFT_111855 [Yamadazyma tenuis ATCC 10573]EGV60068.1 hypothetical protein CANTEDRAFT_111855 [Yamadazyma tenuis ATCC 10573]WEJ94700.1 SWI5-dependent HO expression protein 4 [Yamadazyma tenuis]
MNEIHTQLENLALDDFKKAVQVFEDPTGAGDAATADTLLKYSQSPPTSAVLLQLLRSNITKFLKGLHAIHDDHGAILVNLLSGCSDEQHLTAQVLNSIKLVLKNTTSSTKTSWIDFNLKVYLGLVSEFGVVFPAHLPVLLAYLAPEEESSDVNAVLLFIVVKNIELKQQESFDAIDGFFDYTLETGAGTKTFLAFVKALELLFPICPSVCTRVYTSSLCRDLVLEHVKTITPSSLSLPNPRATADGLLRLVSSSCIDDDCRKFNANIYLDLLKVGSGLDANQYPLFKILSVLCIVKLWNFLQLEADSSFSFSMDGLFDTSIEYLRKENEGLGTAIEALAYLTLNPSLRNRLRADESVVDCLVQLIGRRTEVKDQSLKNDHSSTVYGLLLILSNVTQIKESSQSQETNTVNYLKSVATPKSTTDTTKENTEDILNFNKSLLLDHSIIDTISKLKIIRATTKKGSNNSDQFVNIIYYISLNQEKKVRQELVKQGSLNILLDYLVSHSQVLQKQSGQTRPISSSDSLVETRLRAIRALCKILISVNPALAFNKYSVVTCLPFLVELLGPDISTYTGKLQSNANDAYLHDNVTSLDKYESLLALTNISSMADPKDEIKDSIITKTFDKFLNNFIIEGDSPLIQTAAWELISNLIMKPRMLVKFFNADDQQSLKRLDILIKMLESKDIHLQTTLAGLLANATSEFDMIPRLLVEVDHLRKELVVSFVRIFNSQSDDDDLILRLVYVVLDLVYAAANIGETQIAKFKHDQALKSALAGVLKNNRNEQILEVVVEIIKFTKFK